MNPIPPSTLRGPLNLRRLRRIRQTVTLFFLLVLFPALAVAQSGSPFDTGFIALQNLFTGTVARVASLIAIVIGGYQFAHGEPGSKRALAGIVAGTGIAVLAATDGKMHNITIRGCFIHDIWGTLMGRGPWDQYHSAAIYVGAAHGTAHMFEC